MKPSTYVIAGVSMLASPLLACIQTARMSPPMQQLPADLFKVHVHVTAEPLSIELPLLGGRSKLIMGRKEVDPQGDFAQVISDFEVIPGAHGSFNDRTDYAAALIYAGRFRDAVESLKHLESDFPGHYATASNMGTAYELIGDIENARRWIRMGIERNPDSHAGTEWLHLAILDAKQKMKAVVNWWWDHSVLDGQRKREPADLERALEYQLNERLYFIKENDPIMCDLFYEAARITPNPDKRAYFIRQAERFGTMRDSGIYKLTGVWPRR